MNITKKDIVDLRRRLFDRLDSNYVQSNGDIISLLHLKNILIEELGEYNDIFFNDAEKTINSFNLKQKLLNIVNNNNLYIRRIIPGIKNDKCYLEVLLDEEKRYYGKVLLDFDYEHPELIDLDGSYETYEKVDNVLKANKLKFLTYLAKLESFKSENPGIDYVWDKRNPNEYDVLKIDDGFISARVSLNNIDKLFAGFSSEKDFETSRVNTKEYGELFEYLEFYNMDILAKTEVNLQDLNPLYKYFVGKTIDLGKSRTLSK